MILGDCQRNNKIGFGAKAGLFHYKLRAKLRISAQICRSQSVIPFVRIDRRSPCMLSTLLLPTRLMN